MIKYFAIFSLLISLSCVAEHSSEQSYASSDHSLAVTTESVELITPDINDDHQAVLVSFSDLLPKTNISKAHIVVYRGISYHRPFSYSIRAPPHFS
ncbi:hypothetical protein [Catenovulum adriaticum]|uniref:SbsA Ig-like domain-containing protein n=1 Tax=Catenovulum adriaticum TaxID=2984846 RepID=A0ABY7AIY8_9ALTE|nr:hypothetical protein [Catenovulum sp. TS8]WAJ69553.1 hypothetical protein OLW01_10270 [Catenovulum sp. TS8]